MISAPSSICSKVMRLTLVYGSSPQSMKKPASEADPVRGSPLEFHHNPAAGRDMTSGCGRLLACQAASYRAQLELVLFGKLQRGTHALAREIRDFDAALLHVENHGARPRRACRRRLRRRWWRRSTRVRPGFFLR